MSDRKDKDDAGSPPPAEGKRSGRAAFDERGNSVWEWQLETGVYSRDVNTQKLKKLALDELSIAETAQHRKPTGLGGAGEKRSMPGGGFNPYDNSAQREAGANPYDNARNRNDAQQKSAPAPRPQRTPEDMRRLDEWLKIKKRLDEKKAAGDEDDED